MLCVESAEGHPGIKRKLAALPGLTIHQDGDDGFGAFLFDVSDFDAVAAGILPRKRRRLTVEQREAAQVRLRDYQFRRTSEQNSGAPAAQKPVGRVLSRPGPSDGVL